jgi:outer membrane protein OmpA-like peptidoglycan-associated protein
MYYSIKSVLVVGALACTAIATPILAQGTGQSVEEMTANFKKQKTRGLAIATPTNTTDASAQSTETNSVADPALVVVPKEEQVNVNVSFDFDSAALRDDQKPKLAQLCAALKAADVQKIRILGHTDASGSAAYNQRLSKLRAQEVKRHLETDCGYPATRMEALGVGEEYLFDTNDPKADVNRRVEFQALS